MVKITDLVHSVFFGNFDSLQIFKVIYAQIETHACITVADASCSLSVTAWTDGMHNTADRARGLSSC